MTETKGLRPERGRKMSDTPKLLRSLRTERRKGITIGGTRTAVGGEQGSRWRFGDGSLPRLTACGLIFAGLLGTAIFVAPTTVRAMNFAISVSFGPPPLPVYTQPPCPGDDYVWTPGYWAYDPDDGYYWVPGTWVMAPEPGLLWTPGYWGWEGAAFIWHPGYWGEHVGFYGGIDYGYGYPGDGYYGGEWRGREFYYNRAVNNFGDQRFDHFYDRPVRDHEESHVSYNGGRGGLTFRPTAQQMSFEHERHMEATPVQHRNATAARGDRSQFASVNRGRPEIAAARHPAEFQGNEVVHATRAGGPVNPEALRGGAHPNEHNPNEGAMHANAPHSNRPESRANPREQGGGQFHPTPPAHTQAPHSEGMNPREAHPQQAPSHYNRAPERAPEQAPRQHANPERRAPMERPQERAPQQHANPEHEPMQRTPERALQQHVTPERQAPPAHPPAEHRQEQRGPEHREPPH